MYDEEERRQELLRRRAIRRRHKMREKRRRVRRRRFMLSVLVAAIVLFCLIRLGMLAYSAIHSRIDKTEQQAGQTEQTQSEKQTEQTKYLTEESGLSDNEIKCITKAEGYYWLGGKYGLTVVPESVRN